MSWHVSVVLRHCSSMPSLLVQLIVTSLYETSVATAVTCAAPVEESSEAHLSRPRSLDPDGSRIIVADPATITSETPSGHTTMIYGFVRFVSRQVFVLECALVASLAGISLAWPIHAEEGAAISRYAEKDLFSWYASL
jgi:hypothetical protein